MSAIYTKHKDSSEVMGFSKLVHDSQFETFYESITKLVARQCECPMALITFVDDDHIWIHSEVGFPNVSVVPNRKKFCGFFPVDQNFFEIEDTDKDDWHKTHAVNIEGIQAKYYAGAKINLPLGEMIGVLCIFDVIPKKLTEKQRELLIEMAVVVEKSLVTKSFWKYIK